MAALVGLVGLALVVCLGVCLGVRHLVGHQGRCGERCPDRRLLYGVRLQQGGEGLRLLCVLLHEGLLQGLQFVGAKLIFMRDNNASNTGADS